MQTRQTWQKSQPAGPPNDLRDTRPLRKPPRMALVTFNLWGMHFATDFFFSWNMVLTRKGYIFAAWQAFHLLDG